MARNTQPVSFSFRQEDLERLDELIEIHGTKTAAIRAALHGHENPKTDDSRPVGDFPNVCGYCWRTLNPESGLCDSCP